MRKLVYIAVALACIVCFAVFNSESTTQSLRRVSRHQIWGPTCRTKCTQQNGIICGYASQGCCQIDQCYIGWKGQNCTTGRKIVVPGCTTE